MLRIPNYYVTVDRAPGDWLRRCTAAVDWARAPGGGAPREGAEAFKRRHGKSGCCAQVVFRPDIVWPGLYPLQYPLRAPAGYMAACQVNREPGKASGKSPRRLRSNMQQNANSTMQ